MKTMFVKMSFLCLMLVCLLTLGCLSAVAEDTMVIVAENENEAVTKEIDDHPTTGEETPTIGDPWLCPECNGLNENLFCTSCGEARPVAESWLCEKCNIQNDGNYCGECGDKKSDEGIRINFDASQFVDKLMYMGAGMAGIFLVIGVIILTIVVLSKLTSPKNPEDE